MTEKHHHHHDHDHGKLPVILYIVGLIVFIVALFLPEKSLQQNVPFFIAMLLTGYHVIEEGILDTIRSTVDAKKFTPNIHILMTIAAVGASFIGDFLEGSLLILIFATAHFLEDYAEGKSKREITNLMKMNPTEARLIQPDGSTKIVSVKELKVGDQLHVLNGDQVPTDGVIISGATSIDESAINGESIPQEKQVGDTVFGSTINGNHTFTMEVTKNADETLFAKILQLVNESQASMPKTATKIQKIEPIYVKAVLAIVPIFILIGPFVFGWSWYESFYRGMVFLTVASPCALAASAVPATLSAISNLAKKGVLFKGGAYLANIAQLKAVAFDKTGTLTQGEPSVTDYYFIDHQDQAHIDVIVAMEKQANHPLAEAITRYFEIEETIELEMENEIGRGLVAHHEGDEYRIGKPSLFEKVPAQIKEHEIQYANEGKTVVYYAVNQEVKGLIAMMDLPNEEAKEVISYLNSEGIHTVMITGDATLTGEAVARQIGMDEVVGNVLPENKSEIIKQKQAEYGSVAMLGDGVNDAPALVQANIGIAMGDGTDVAMEVADAVLMKNDLSNLSYAHRVSKKLDKIIWQNIYFSLAVIILLVILNILGKMNLSIGVIAHEGSTLVVIFNGLRMLLPPKK
ncbi:heavy metal translocating P-type ATPase [Vagococcus sp.]|uniref:heavy metal translocating P-type ATPase n=1 Tax=Vagococcus sp. TaxID=1933889 RepID=UPI00257F2B47|nr:heavy metal translocating P-type ATPase [Vagococcus sp.]